MVTIDTKYALDTLGGTPGFVAIAQRAGMHRSNAYQWVKRGLPPQIALYLVALHISGRLPKLDPAQLVRIDDTATGTGEGPDGKSVLGQEAPDFELP